MRDILYIIKICIIIVNVKILMYVYVIINQVIKIDFIFSKNCFITDFDEIVFKTIFLVTYI